MSTRWKYTLGTIFAITALLVSFGFGFAAGMLSPTGSESLDRVITAWDTITGEYVDPSLIDESALAEAAIEGMMNLIDDPYSAYLDSHGYQAVLDDFEGTYSGIGAEMAVRDGNLIIIAVYPDSPAAGAGLVAGDVITAVDGQSTSELTMAEIGLLVRGDAGTTVTLSIDRDGEDFSFTITRATITPPSVDLEMLGNIAHITIASFNQHTDEELLPIIEEINSNGATAIVLDLRYNPGGLVSTVVNTASYFITDGVVMTIRDRDGGETEHKVVDQPETTDLPMVVLVNGFSASGSEVLAGALQDYGRAVVAGAQTFGKGSVNQLYDLPGGTGIYLTIARWYTPNGNLIEGIGITPDYPLELTGNDLLDWAIDYLS